VTDDHGASQEPDAEHRVKVAFKAISGDEPGKR